ncbi:MAG: prevent-host-death protein [Kangiella sp.]|nr:MAG: prevent-host-death protein [Kangiella sp.]
MKKVRVGEFKANFSEIIKQVKENGQEYIVGYGKKNEATAVLIPLEEYKQLKGKRQFGILKGKGSFEITDDFKLDDETFLSV